MSETRVPVAESAMALATKIVTAYVSKNHVQQSELPNLLARVHSTLINIDQPQAPEAEPVEQPTAVQIRKSITPEAIYSFEDGKPYKTLGRHLKTRGLTPDSYRAKWGLPKDYPMVSPNYSAQRSALARSIGLGQPRREAGEVSQAA